VDGKWHIKKAHFPKPGEMGFTTTTFFRRQLAANKQNKNKKRVDKLPLNRS
jgi:hypothetical protein